MMKRVMALLVGSVLLMSSITAVAAPSPSVSTDTEVTSEVLVTSDKTVDEIIDESLVLVEALVESGELDDSGMLTDTGVAMVTSILETISYTENGETLESGLVVQVSEDGREVAGVIISLDGEIIGTIELGAIIVTNSTDGVVVVEDGVITVPSVVGLEEEATVQMEGAITQLFGTEETITEEEAEELLRDVLTSISNITVTEDGDLSVLNVVDIDLSDFAKSSVQDYNGLALVTVDLGVADSEYVAAIHNYEGSEWENIPCVNNGDGTVTVAMSTMSPVAFIVSDTPIIAEVSADVEDTTEDEVVEDEAVVEDEVEEDETVVEDTTGETEAETDSMMIIYVVIAVILVVGIFFILMKKKKKEETPEEK